jgi:hypothetical protein
MPTFHHSGDYGDIIYCLPTLRALGGGVLELGPAGHGTRLTMDIERCRIIKPLLEAQPYVEEVIFGTNKCDHDLDRFRFMHERTDLNLAERSLLAHNQDPAICAEPWLTVPNSIKLGKSVVISRTWDRHHNALFCWPEMLERYGRNAVFLGIDQDYQVFCDTFRTTYTIPWYQCQNLLEFAMVISGAELFIGNQSAGYAVAEALKMSTIVEVSATSPNCFFHRANASYFPSRSFALASPSAHAANPPSAPSPA